MHRSFRIQSYVTTFIRALSSLTSIASDFSRRAHVTTLGASYFTYIARDIARISAWDRRDRSRRGIPKELAPRCSSAFPLLISILRRRRRDRFALDPTSPAHPHRHCKVGANYVEVLSDYKFVAAISCLWLAHAFERIPGDASTEFNRLHFETTAKLISDKFCLRRVYQRRDLPARSSIAVPPGSSPR